MANRIPFIVKHDPSWIMATSDDSVINKELNRNEYEFLAVSAIRALFKNEPVNCIPTINELVVSTESDQCGNNIFSEMTYSKSGYRATFGGRVVDRCIIWQCYAD